MIDKKIKLFLKESNAIEDIWDEDSLQQAIYAWEFVIGENKLSTSIILETHKILTLHQKLMQNEKGYFRQEQVWVGGREGKPWFVVSELIKNWCERVNGTINQTYPGNLTDDTLEAFIKKDHIEYEKIHPFIDGNGRTGRIFMNWQRVKVGLSIEVILEKEKQKYYDWFK